MIDPKKIELEKTIDTRILKIVPDYLQSKAFTDRKLTDTPTDDLQIVNRRYVNLNGTTANRPSGAVPGQQYFDTTIGRPVFFNPNSSVWTDGAGSVS